jgi:membrane-anchored mycosin MYCP
MTATDQTAEALDAVRDHLDSKPNELLVALAHAQLVTRTLDGLGIRASILDSSDDLGLARLMFTGELDSAELSNIATAHRIDEEIVRGDRVGAVIQAVKDRISGYQPWGWVPTLGRNRLVGHVNGTNGRVIVGDGDPVPAGPKALAPRGEGGLSAAEGFSEVGRGVRICVVDTALRQHTWLRGAWASPSPEPLQTVPRLSSRAGHATFVAGLVLTQAPAAGVDVLAVLDDEGRADAWAVAKGIVEGGRRGADIINLSLACYTADGLPPLALARAIDRLNPDTVVVAAAGNEGESKTKVPTARGEIDLSTAPAWPAALDGVVAVGAANHDRTKASFSPNGAWVDVLAPGNPVSTLIGGIGPVTNTTDGYANWAGTSFAAALVSGAIAAQTAPGLLSARQAWIRIRETPPDGFLDPPST